MQTAILVFAILGFVFGFLGFLTGCWAVVDLLASKRSTHRITQMPVTYEETTVENDIPQHIRDQLPSPVEKLTAEQYLLWEARQQAEEEFGSDSNY